MIEKGENTKQKILQAKSEQLKEKLKVGYVELDREVKKSAQNDKRVFTEGMAEKQK